MLKHSLNEDELRRIQDAVEREFPHDPALQQIHIARKILSIEAERKGVTLLQHSADLVRGSRQSNSK